MENQEKQSDQVAVPAVRGLWVDDLIPTRALMLDTHNPLSIFFKPLHQIMWVCVCIILRGLHGPTCFRILHHLSVRVCM